MPPRETRALLLLLALAVAGQGVRYLLTRPGESPGGVQLLATLSPGSPRAQRDSAMQQARPLGSGETIDLDRAPLSELTRLPRVGPRLAKAILAHRTKHGPFGGLAGLDRVPGIGPNLLRTLEPHVAFSGAAVQRGSGAGSSSYDPGHPLRVPDPPPLGPSALRAPAPLNINSATLRQLDSLSGVGPAKAAAILRYREEHGPFTAVEQLGQVPGFGPQALERLRDRLTVH
jgi:competence ComEA-like helix-hairpin-helix protein